MVCNRCKMVVRAEFEKLGYRPASVELGTVTIDQDLSDEDRISLDKSLTELGFSLIKDKKSVLTEKIKTTIIELVREQDSELKIKLSDYLVTRLNHDYYYLSKLFSETEGTTIEKYFIAQKIENVKELLEYGELTLSEIAYRLNYSSVAHLSTQFKKVVGMSPSQFKELHPGKRKSLDEV